MPDCFPKKTFASCKSRSKNLPSFAELPNQMLLKNLMKDFSFEECEQELRKTEKKISQKKYTGSIKCDNGVALLDLCRKFGCPPEELKYALRADDIFVESCECELGDNDLNKRISRFPTLPLLRQCCVHENCCRNEQLFELQRNLIIKCKKRYEKLKKEWLKDLNNLYIEAVRPLTAAELMARKEINAETKTTDNDLEDTMHIPKKRKRRKCSCIKLKENIPQKNIKSKITILNQHGPEKPGQAITSPCLLARLKQEENRRRKERASMAKSESQTINTTGSFTRSSSKEKIKITGSILITRAGSKQDSRAGSKLDTRPGSKHNSREGSKLITEVSRKSNSGEESKLDTRPGSKSYSRQGSKLDTRSGSRLNSRAGSKLETRSGSKSREGSKLDAPTSQRRLFSGKGSQLYSRPQSISNSRDGSKHDTKLGSIRNSREIPPPITAGNKLDNSSRSKPDTSVGNISRGSSSQQSSGSDRVISQENKVSGGSSSDNNAIRTQRDKSPGSKRDDSPGSKVSRGSSSEKNPRIKRGYTPGSKLSQGSSSDNIVQRNKRVRSSSDNGPRIKRGNSPEDKVSAGSSSDNAIRTKRVKSPGRTRSNSPDSKGSTGSSSGYEQRMKRGDCPANKLSAGSSSDNTFKRNKRFHSPGSRKNRGSKESAGSSSSSGPEIKRDSNRSAGSFSDNDARIKTTPSPEIKRVDNSVRETVNGQVKGRRISPVSRRGYSLEGKRANNSRGTRANNPEVKRVSTSVRQSGNSTVKEKFVSPVGSRNNSAGRKRVNLSENIKDNSTRGKSGKIVRKATGIKTENTAISRPEQRAESRTLKTAAAGSTVEKRARSQSGSSKTTDRTSSYGVERKKSEFQERSSRAGSQSRSSKTTDRTSSYGVERKKSEFQDRSSRGQIAPLSPTKMVNKGTQT